MNQPRGFSSLIALLVIAIIVLGGAGYFIAMRGAGSSHMATSTAQTEIGTSTAQGAAPSSNTEIKGETEPIEPATSVLIPDTLTITYPSSKVSIAVGQKITITYRVGSNIVASDPAVVERSIVDASTNKVVSGYVAVPVKAGTYSFDWTPSQSGTYQALLSISLHNKMYPARSAVITVGSGTSVTTTTTNTAAHADGPNLIYGHISSGNVIASYTDFPPNVILHFVNSATNEPYMQVGVSIRSGGSGPLSIEIPFDMPKGTYYLIALDGYSGKTIAQSASFVVD